MNENILAYSSKEDRLNGIAGMVMGLVVFDGERFINRVDTTLTDLDVVVLNPDFFIADNPAISAKTVWNVHAHRFRMSAAMVLGNVLARTVCGTRRPIDPDTLAALLQLLAGESAETLGLSPEENRELCLQTYNELRRAYSHPTVASLLRRIATEISGNDPLTSDILSDILSPIHASW